MKKHWSCMLHLSTSHCKKSTWALMPGMAQNLYKPHAFNASIEGWWFNAARSTSSCSRSHQSSMMYTLHPTKRQIRMQKIKLFGSILRIFGLKTLAAGTAPSLLETVRGSTPCLHGRCGPLTFSPLRKSRGPRAASVMPAGPTRGFIA